MPLLDALRDNDALPGSISHDASHVEDINTAEDVEGHNGNNGNRRQKIVVVGLGMVAISFMYVHPAQWDSKRGSKRLMIF